MDESSRWYRFDGKSIKTITGAKGQEVKYNLSHAKKNKNGLPSVTTIIGDILAKPGLNKWKEEQILLASLTLPRKEGESSDQWVERIREDAWEYTKSTIDTGKKVHADISNYYKHGYAPGLDISIKAIFALDKMIAENNISIIQTEEGFANNEKGFGGTPDLILLEQNQKGSLIDIKTTDLSKYKTPYMEWGLQIAAYKNGLYLSDVICVELIIDRSTGDFIFHYWDDNEIEKYWKMFSFLLEFWFLMKDYDPRSF